MAVTSRIGAAEDALLALLAARPAIDCPLDPAHPGKNLQREHMWMGRTTAEAQVWDVTGMGAQNKAESFTMQVLVRVSGTNYQLARDRALMLAGEVEQALRADPHLLAEVFDASVVAVNVTKWMSPEDGWVVGVTTDVGVEAFLA